MASKLSRRTSLELTTAVWRRSLKAGDPLPTLPLPLTLSESVPIDLEQTYAAAARRVYLP